MLLTERRREMHSQFAEHYVWMNDIYLHSYSPGGLYFLEISFNKRSGIHCVTLADAWIIPCWGFIPVGWNQRILVKVFEQHDNLLPHRSKGNCHAQISCHMKYGWCTVQPSGGDSKWKRSEAERQGLKPSSFSPRLTSKRGISPAGNFCCVNTQP